MQGDDNDETVPPFGGFVACANPIDELRVVVLRRDHDVGARTTLGTDEAPRGVRDGEQLRVGEFLL